eukprot:1386078-Amorphochlora_amoeboformis.AAC.1
MAAYRGVGVPFGLVAMGLLISMSVWSTEIARSNFGLERPSSDNYFGFEDEGWVVVLQCRVVPIVERLGSDAQELVVA